MADRRDDNELQFAGHYRLDSILIKSFNGIELDFKDLNLELNIYESIFDNAIYGTCTLRDSANHIQNLPIVGQEEISFTLSTPTYSGVIDFKEYKGRIYKITDKNRTLEKEQVYTLHFVTKETLRNARTRLKKSYTGTTSDIVSKILKDPNGINTKKPIFIEPTKSIHKIVATHNRPFDLISMLAKRSESKNDKHSPGFLFFENHRGYNFRSYESLSYDSLKPKKPKFHYYDRVYQRDDKGLSDIDADLATIADYKIIESNDLIANTATGMLASTHYTHDIHTKTFTKTEFNYFDQFDKKFHVDEFEDSKQQLGPFYSQTPETINNKSVSDHPQSKIFVSSRATKLHSQSATDPREYDNRSNIWLQSMKSNKSAYDNCKLSLEVAGNCDIAAGDLIQVSLPSLESQYMSSPNKRIDELYSGRYIVSYIRHIFNNIKHTMVMECVKDNFYTRLSDLDTPYETLETQLDQLLEINNGEFNDAS